MEIEASAEVKTGSCGMAVVMICPVVKCETGKRIHTESLCNTEREMNIGADLKTGNTVVAEYIADFRRYAHMICYAILEVDISESTVIV